MYPAKNLYSDKNEKGSKSIVTNQISQAPARSRIPSRVALAVG